MVITIVTIFYYQKYKRNNRKSSLFIGDWSIIYAFFGANKWFQYSQYLTAVKLTFRAEYWMQNQCWIQSIYLFKSLAERSSTCIRHAAIGAARRLFAVFEWLLEYSCRFNYSQTMGNWKQAGNFVSDKSVCSLQPFQCLTLYTIHEFEFMQIV